MKPIDYRDETWESLQDRLHGLRLAALSAWRTHGPGTTREVARRSGIDLLTFRPRTTELHQLGLVVVFDPPASAAATPAEPTKGEGTYRALSEAEAHAHFDTRKALAAQMPSCQPELKIFPPTAP